ncbi:MAG: thymidine phosphorylase [Oscillospiraceae bacterium]|nr:thymidine phosphorylase [Oscillospiraceae bacterium]
MQMYDLIARTRHGEALCDADIRSIVEGFTAGEIPEYMMAAWLMAVCCNGLTAQETTALTLAMRDSGDCLDLSAIGGVTVDKHSTGGIGDKTTLVIAPLVAACGGYVPKMSGRGLGFTGGTIDKLESIPGFSTSLAPDRFLTQVRSIGCSVIAQSGDLAPADKKMYALRNLTATVDSIPLICSSIMSKKLALGADCILLDVKYGTGAFMKTPQEAAELARAMTQVGQLAGKRCRALVTDMNAPLGTCVGNALEVEEAIRILRGESDLPLTELCLTLAAHMLSLSDHGTPEECRSKAGRVLTSGEALERFSRMIAAQGGDAGVTEHPERLPRAQYTLDVRAASDGFLQSVRSEEIGLACLGLGAGRTADHAGIDPGAGVILRRFVGDAVRTGDVLCTVCGSTQTLCETAAVRVQNAVRIGEEQPEAVPLVSGIIG